MGLSVKIFSLVVLIPLLSLAFLGRSVAQQHSSTKVGDVSSRLSNRAVEKKVQSLSLDQKVGQLFIFGFSSKTFDAKTKKLLQNHKPGGLIVFSRNISSHQQIAKLNYSARKMAEKVSGLPLLIMVDQEGGSVTRIKTKPTSPSALALGMTQDLPLIKDAGRISGEILNLLGFNMNLAPVMDLSPPERKNFIGNRSFGNDPEKVKLMAQAFADGLKGSAILPTAKHFPGHGGVTQDSHKKLPVKLDTLEELYNDDLVPFRHFVQQSYPSAIMVAHVAFPNIDPTGVPAAFSSVMINDILRDRMGYNGLVITDDIEMAGADSAGDIGERAVKALESGCDMVMVAWSLRRQAKAISAVKQAIKTGRLSMDRVDDSLRRIVRSKLLLELSSKKTPTPQLISNQMQSLVKDLKQLTHRISHSNFKKSAENYRHLKGQSSSKQRVLIFSADGSFLRSFKELNLGEVKFYPLSPKSKDPVEGSVRSQPKALSIYYVTGEGTARRLRNFSSQVKERLIVVNATHPGLIGSESDYLAVFDVYSRDYKTGRWMAEFLFEDQIRAPSSRPQQVQKNFFRRRSFN